MTWTDLRDQEGEKQERGGDTPWLIDPIKLPSRLCGHGGGVSDSRLGLILVSQGGRILLRMPKLVHLCCRLQRKRHETVA